MPHLALSFLVPLHPPSHPSHLSVHPPPHLRSHHPHLHPCFPLGKFPWFCLSQPSRPPSHPPSHLRSHPHFRPCFRVWGLPLLLLPWPSHPCHPSSHLRSPHLCSPHQTTHLRMPHLALSFLVPLHPSSHHSESCLSSAPQPRPPRCGLHFHLRSPSPAVSWPVLCHPRCSNLE